MSAEISRIERGQAQPHYEGPSIDRRTDLVGRSALKVKLDEMRVPTLELATERIVTYVCGENRSIITQFVSNILADFTYLILDYLYGALSTFTVETVNELSQKESGDLLLTGIEQLNAYTGLLQRAHDAYRSEAREISFEEYFQEEYPLTIGAESFEGLVQKYADRAITALSPKWAKESIAWVVERFNLVHMAAQGIAEKIEGMGAVALPQSLVDEVSAALQQESTQVNIGEMTAQGFSRELVEQTQSTLRNMTHLVATITESQGILMDIASEIASSETIVERLLSVITKELSANSLEGMILKALEPKEEAPAANFDDLATALSGFVGEKVTEDLGDPYVRPQIRQFFEIVEAGDLKRYENARSWVTHPSIEAALSSNWVLRRFRRRLKQCDRYMELLAQGKEAKKPDTSPLLKVMHRIGQAIRPGLKRVVASQAEKMRPYIEQALPKAQEYLDRPSHRQVGARLVSDLMRHIFS